MARRSSRETEFGNQNCMNHLLFVKALIDLLTSPPLLLSFAIWQASGWLVQAVYRYDVYIDTESAGQKGVTRPV